MQLSSLRPEDGDFAVTWVKMYGTGRVFYSRGTARGPGRADGSDQSPPLERAPPAEVTSPIREQHRAHGLCVHATGYVQQSVG